MFLSGSDCFSQTTANLDILYETNQQQSYAEEAETGWEGVEPLSLDELARLAAEDFDNGNWNGNIDDFDPDNYNPDDFY